MLRRKPASISQLWVIDNYGPLHSATTRRYAQIHFMERLQWIFMSTLAKGVILRLVTSIISLSRRLLVFPQRFSSLSQPQTVQEASICSGCGWSQEKQNTCNYHSHVKLIYGVSDRGVWSLGSRFILKERPADAPNFESLNIRFLQRNTAIPIPNILTQWTEEDGRCFVIMERLRGTPLSEVWGKMSTVERDKLARQTVHSLHQLRNLTSMRIKSLSDDPVYSAFLFPSGFGKPHGPLSSDDELWEEMTKTWDGFPETARQHLREQMPPATPYTFTHGDLAMANIMVEDGKLIGIIDWESSGYFPIWWEFTCAGIGLSDDDKQWKNMLRQHMGNYSEAWQFWRNFYILSKYPNLDEEGMALLKALE